MADTVCFRDFEERDVDFILKCKNDDELNRMVVGQSRKFTRQDAENWVKGCIIGNPTFKFWAICINDEEKRIIGWAALSEIDSVNKSASTHSLVIGDPDYNDGFAWIESVYFLFKYSFEVLKLNRVYGVSLVGHPMSNRIGALMFMKTEGILRQAIFKNDKFYDLQYDAILKDEFFAHKEAGDYEMMKIIKRLRKLRYE